MRNIVAILMVLLLLCACALCEEMPELTPETPLRSARIRAVGDIMSHTKQLEIALQADGSYDFSPQYALIAESLADADYTIANLETTIGMYNDKPYSGFPRFNAPESLLAAIKDAGVDFLTLANNHILDRYFDGMVITVNNVEAYGFDFSGAFRTQAEHDAACIYEVNGIKIGFLCYTWHTNTMEGYCDPAAAEYGVKYLYEANYAADCAILKSAGAEFIIALPHWGNEYLRQPEIPMREEADEMIAAGVDAILGSHPHMVQPIEWVTSGGRTGLVAWSMGNFISDMKVQYTDSGIIVDFTLVENPDGGFDIVNVGYVPLFCWRQERMTQTLPIEIYYDNRPDGMSDTRYSRLRACRRELIELIGDEFTLLEK